MPRKPRAKAEPAGPTIIREFQLCGRVYRPGDDLPEVNAKELARLHRLGRVK